jgi:hypothetical protein
MNENVPTGYRAMGGVGFGMRANRAINPSQPASYTSCDSLTFMFDIAASASWSHYQDAGGVKNKANGNLEYLTMQFPLWKRWIAMSVGLLPYSSVGYSISLKDSIPGYNFTKDYEGDGNISEVYGGLSFNIMDWFAVGANVYYMFGEVSNYRALTFTEAGMQDVAMYSMLNVSSVRTRVGAQLFHTFDNQDAFAVGAVWEPQLPLRGKYTVVETSWGDTVQSGGAAMKVPMQWGVGASYTWQQRLTLAFDYTYQGWCSVQTFSNQALRSRAIYAAGVEYRHNPYGRNYVERVCWRLGAKLTDPYQKNVEGKEIKVSIGVGFPLRNAGTVFNATVEYGHRGALLKEDYLKLTINAAINETWFFKRKL